MAGCRQIAFFVDDAFVFFSSAAYRSIVLRPVEGKNRGYCSVLQINRQLSGAVDVG